MNAYYQTIKSTKQQLGFSLRSSWLSGAGLVVMPGCDGAGLLVYDLCKYIYFVLCLNNVKHCFSAQLEWDKKPELTVLGTVLCQVELNGCWQKPLMDSWRFSLPRPSFAAESDTSYQIIIPRISLPSSVGFPWVLRPTQFSS